MIIISNYRKEQDEKGVIKILSEEKCICPICSGELKALGRRKRVVINAEGNKEKLSIRRLRCTICRKIHHELPDYVIPYKRHCVETIENIINGNTEDVCCDFVTEYRIRSWWVSILLYFEKILASLKIKYEMEFSAKTAPREIIRALVNSNLWVHTRSAMMST